MYKNNLLANSVRLALVSGAMTAAFAVPAVYADEEVERIEVTGSRIKRTDMETSSPIHVMDAEQIKMSGFTNVEDILNQLPQLETASNAFQSNGAQVLLHLTYVVWVVTVLWFLLTAAECKRVVSHRKVLILTKFQLHLLSV